MIAHWCDAMGDDNPCYTDEAFAAQSVHGGIVAPPAMLDVWDRGGLRIARNAGSPRTGVIQELFAGGYDSIVAVNTKLEFRRYLRPGELVSNVETLDDVSPLKHTARGPGYFVTTRHRFTNQRDEHVGDLMFRILLFDAHPPEAPPDDKAGPTPATGPSLTPGPSPDPDPSSSGHLPRPSTRTTGSSGTASLATSCESSVAPACGHLHMPPGPRCPGHRSFGVGLD